MRAKDNTMQQSMTIAVFGATGAQGGSVARALLARRDPTIRVRALTRQPGAPRAQALAALGAEVQHADLDEPSSLIGAIQGADAVFGVTNFWEHFSPDRELAQARHLAEAVRRTRLRHLVWSTLEDTRRWVPLEDPRWPTLMQHYKVPHMDAKGASDEFMLAAGVPLTLLRTSFYWDNLIHFGMAPQPGPDGTLQFLLPMGDRPLPGTAAEDIGRCAAALLLRGPKGAVQTVGVAGEHLSGAQMAAQMAQLLQRPVRHVDPGHAGYAALGFPGAADLANMFAFKHDFNDEYCARRNVQATRRLHPGLLDFRSWLALHAAELSACIAPQETAQEVA